MTVEEGSLPTCPGLLPEIEINLPFKSKKKKKKRLSDPLESMQNVCRGEDYSF